RRALAVGLGTLVGCTPFFGLHLLMSTVLARLFRLSRVITYLAANINNPLTFPFLLWLEAGLGTSLVTGRWPELSLAEFRAIGVVEMSRNILIGSVALGLALGALLALVTYVLGNRRDGCDPFADLREAAAEPYLETGIRHWEFVRGKLRFDPVYRRLLDEGLLPRPGRLVDLGCGRGILLALLSAPVEEWRNARPHSESTRAVRVRHVAPPGMQFIGLELDARLARVARRALAGAATIEQANLVDCPIPSCATAVLLDVLHYLPAAAQEDLLDRVALALGPRGVLLLREADRDGGLGFRFTVGAERLRAFARGHFRQRFCFRSQAEWEELLRRRGLRVEALPVAEGSLFANVVLVAHRGGG
ncbi:MAG TPA: DUF2062 domain-containing protein, partial [Thermoanaerobaculia bacterium]|nr:DUF2062 domain-containing protein [Thermoanaerobaculia bacterium]